MAYSGAGNTLMGEPDPYNPIVRFLYSATEPVLGFARKYIPPLGGSIDLSPIVVLLLIVFLKNAVVRSLFQMAAGFNSPASRRPTSVSCRILKRPKNTDDTDRWSLRSGLHLIPLN